MARLDRRPQILRIIEELVQIGDEDTENFQLLGKRFGNNLENCIQLGLQNIPLFEERVRYYVCRQNPQADIPCGTYFVDDSQLDKILNIKSLGVEFYGNK